MAETKQHRFLGRPISPTNTRRLHNFKANRRGYWSFWIFGVIFILTLFAEVIANDRPIFVWYDGKPHVPVFVAYNETEFGGEFELEADYTDEFVQELIEEKGWMIWPPVPYSHQRLAYDLEGAAPTAPDSKHWLGTDDQGRDVVASLIHGFRISVLFGLTLTFFSSIIGVANRPPSVV